MLVYYSSKVPKQDMPLHAERDDWGGGLEAITGSLVFFSPPLPPVVTFGDSLRTYVQSAHHGSIPCVGTPRENASGRL